MSLLQLRNRGGGFPYCAARGEAGTAPCAACAVRSASFPGTPNRSRNAGYGSVKSIKDITAEAWLTGGLAVLGIFGFAFMSKLVAAPKVLFGRALSAIPPSLFPALVLGALAVLACLLLYSLRRSLMSKKSTVFEGGALRRAIMLFAVMLFYALTMAPLGFFISSALSMVAVSWIAGNRSILQICAVSVICPVGLYLVSTRGLAVSLPELSSIEFFYARLLDFSSEVAVEVEAVAPAGSEGASQ